MKATSLSLFAGILLISSCCVAQAKPEAGNPGADRASKVLIVLGKVSADARTLFTDLDSEWKVANASVLKGYEDRVVRVRCYVDAEKNQLHILSVTKDRGQSTVAVHYGDSAFRR